MATLRGDIYSLLRPGLRKVFGGYDMSPAQFKEFLTIEDSDKAEEQYAQVSLVSYAQVKKELGPMNTDDGPRQKWLTRIVNETVAQSFVMSSESIDDNQYQKDFPMKTKALYDSMLATKEVSAAMFLVNGFTVNQYDGVPLFSADHTTDLGTVSNLIAGDPSEATINDAMILVSKFTSQAGIPIAATLKKAIISPKNYFIFSKLFKSTYETQSANNGINPIKSENLMPEGYSVNRYLSFVSAAGQNAWFITTSIPGLIFQQREKIKYDMQVDPYFGSVRTFAKERYGIGCRDFMSAVGSPGA